MGVPTTVVILLELQVNYSYFPNDLYQGLRALSHRFGSGLMRFARYSARHQANHLNSLQIRDRCPHADRGTDGARGGCAAIEKTQWVMTSNPESIPLSYNSYQTVFPTPPCRSRQCARLQQSSTVPCFGPRFDSHRGRSNHSDRRALPH